jgi:DNA uptake protein ComE-like DNA-binding protein
MRKKILAAALSGTVFALAACSGGTEEAAETTEATTAGETEIVDTASEAATVVDANIATAEQLAGTEGVSPELAAAIVAGQPYASVTDLNTKLLETLSAEEAADVLVNVFVPVNLNTGSEEEIRLIPGMTDKMVHEFEEYRPYADMGVFDREIGKYVDEAEVARFRNYVTL